MRADFQTVLLKVKFFSCNNKCTSKPLYLCVKLCLKKKLYGSLLGCLLRTYCTHKRLWS